MTEFEMFVKSLAKGLHTIAENASLLAEKLNDLADAQGSDMTEPETEQAETEEKPASETKAEGETKAEAKNSLKTGARPNPKTSAKTKVNPKAAASPKKAAGKKASGKKRKTKGKASDTGKVLNLISEAEGGIGIDELSQKTGFAKGKLHGIVYRLRKSGKILSPKKGIYTTP